MPIQFGDDKPPDSSENVGKKRVRPAPAFGPPPPFKPVTGTHATLRVEGIHPYCAMMQVAAADTYEDYLVCRGFDPRILKFLDYAAGDPDKLGISVAKPFGNRTVSKYTVGEVFPAFLPTQGAVGEGKAENYVPPSPTAVDWRVGQNAGTAPVSNPGGQPTALVDTIEELVDHNGVQVQWLLIDRGEGTTEHYWGKATANWTDNGALCDHITVNPCDDCEGANPTAAVVTVLLPKADGQDPNILINDVLAYAETTDGSYVCVSDYLAGSGGVTYWGIAQHNWQDNLVDCPYVMVKLCEDCDGTNPTGDEIEVLLPRANDSDPNVIAGEVIGYLGASDGTYVCVTDYMDCRIRTGKLWTGAASDIPAGWATMDGTANSGPNGGSGINVNQKFLRGQTGASGNTGGEPNHTHVIEVTVPDHLEQPFEHSHTHTLEVIVDPHTVEELNHNHGLGDTLGDFFVVGSSPDPQLPTFRVCTEEAWGPVWNGDLEVDEVDYTTCGNYSYGPIYHRAEIVGTIDKSSTDIPAQKHYPEASCDTVEKLARIRGDAVH